MADPGMIAWYVPFADLERRKYIPWTIDFTAGFLPLPNTPPSFGYFQPLSEPIRFKVGLASREQRELTIGLVPVIPSFGYFEALSEPVRFKVGLSVREQSSFTSGFIPIPLIPPSFGYYANLSNPVWFRRILTDEIPFLAEWDFPITTWQFMCVSVSVQTWEADAQVGTTIWSKEDTPI